VVVCRVEEWIKRQRLSSGFCEEACKMRTRVLDELGGGKGGKKERRRKGVDTNVEFVGRHCGVIDRLISAG